MKLLLHMQKTVYHWLMANVFGHLFTPKHTNNYRPRIIHPEGFFVLTTIALVFHILMASSAIYSPIGNVLGYASSITASQVLESTNAERRNAGQEPLSLNGKLTQAAIAKATNMFEEQYWAHVSPKGLEPWVFIRNSGYSYASAGENLAKDFGDTGSMMSAWMASPTHRANIVNSKYKEIGIAVVDGKMNGVETTLVVQMFGTPKSAAAVAKPAQTTAQVAQKPAPKASVAPVSSTQPKASVEPTATPETTPQPEENAPSFPENVLTAVEKMTQTHQVYAAQQTLNDSAHPSVSPLQISKAVFLAMIFLLMLVLMYDMIIARQKNLVRIVGKNLAHIIFFAALAVVMILFKGGSLV